MRQNIFLLSVTKNCETPIKLTHSKPEETLELKRNKPRKTFHFNTRIQIKGDWMLGLTSSEILNSIFNITQEKYKFEFYTDDFDSEFSFFVLKDTLAEVLGLPLISPENLQQEIHEKQHIIKTYRELLIEKSAIDGYYILFMDYVQSPFRDFEGYHRNLFGLKDYDIQLILKQ